MSISDPAASPPQLVDSGRDDSSLAGSVAVTTSDDTAEGPCETHATTKRVAAVRPRGKGWFRAFWRWHFYASFLVVPVLLVLAVTGLIYLLRFQPEPMLNAVVMTVEPPAGAQAAARQSYDSQLAAVTTAHPDVTVVSMTEPSALDRSTVFSTTAGGEPLDVYVNP